MQQLEIQYFFPLTEQIPLDLDFTGSTAYAEKKRKEMWSANTLTISNGDTGLISSSVHLGSNTIAFIPSNDVVGYWEICKDIQMHNKKRPSWVNRKLAKIFFGWVWKDK